jgi:arylsulfatase A-like enzyme
MAWAQARPVTTRGFVARGIEFHPPSPLPLIVSRPESSSFTGKLEAKMRHLVILVLLCFAPLASAAKPNFVVLLVDDGAFMDFGGYGGEAHTPNIDQLANEGVRFSNYHTSPMCAPSRAMLLTGLDSHRTGVATLPETISNEQRDSRGYQLRLLPGVETIADLLKNRGYETFMTGKWHLGRGQGDLPDDHGFDRSFALGASGADNWEQKSFLPFYDEAPWFEDGAPAKLPEDFYSSRFLVDKMMEYLDFRETQKPFFAYIAFQAIHVPVQAPREFTDRYEGVYRDGWGALRERRFARARSLGLVPKDAVPPAPHPALRPWASLSAQEREHFESTMMLNAGMLEAMDHHVGRLVSYLEDKGELANTVFVITSDNGPESGDPTADRTFQFWMNQNGYHTDSERLGEKGYWGAIGPEWASAAASPGALFKMYASEGGTRVPLIMRGPGIDPQPFNNALNFVTDVAPTIAEMAGFEAAQMDGRSLVPLLSGAAVEIYDRSDPIGLELAGNSALFKGDYKLTRNTLPHGDAEWRLHDLHRDPAESQDLSKQMPALRQELMDDYDRYAEANGVVALPKDFDIMTQININTRNKWLANNQSTLIAIGSGLAVVVFLLFRVVIRKVI